jgi:hypothetical protein
LLRHAQFFRTHARVWFKLAQVWFSHAWVRFSHARVYFHTHEYILRTLQCSQNWFKISWSFVQHQAVIIFKNSKDSISSTLIIFLLNYTTQQKWHVFFLFWINSNIFDRFWPADHESGLRFSLARRVFYLFTHESSKMVKNDRFWELEIRV